MHPNGHIVYCGGFGPFTKGHINLTGIHYARTGHTALRLSDGVSGDARYMQPSFTLTSPTLQQSTMTPHRVEQRFALLHGRAGRVDRKPWEFNDVIGCLDRACYGYNIFAAIGGC